MMPKQKPHRSEQTVGTPRAFLIAIERRFGPIVIDLAATEDNRVCAEYLGPGSPLGWDSLLVPWRHQRGWQFLNPPFGDIAPWAQKCAEESAKGAHVLFLVPASVGSNWFNTWVRPHAYVFELTPRLTFVGHTQVYPKDLILCCYGPERFVGRDSWNWRATAIQQLGFAA